MTAPRTPPSTARAGAHDPATVFVRTVAEAVRQSKIAVQNDPAPLANPLTAGTHLTGGSYNGSVSVIFATDATNANTASTIVARDASGNFAATTITAALTGNASTATALQTPRTINGTSFDGTANIVVTAAAGTLTGTTLNATVVTSSLTSVGTLTGLTVKGTVAIAGASSGAVSFVAPAAAGSATYVLPDADGSNNYVLTTDGSGNLSWSVKTGGSGGSISTINGDGSAAQTLAAGAGLTIADAGAVHTLALDLNYAPTYTTTITAAGFAGPLTGTVVTASQPDITTAANLTTIGTLVAGAVPASLVTAGTFGAGNFAFPGNLTVDNNLIADNAIVTDLLQARTGDLLIRNAASTLIATISNATGKLTYGFAADFAGDLSVATSKFTVDHTTGNTVVAGTVTTNNGGGLQLDWAGLGTAIGYLRAVSTGANMRLGVEGAAGGAILTGAPAYATVLGTENATAVVLGTNGSANLTIASGGAATFSSTIGASNFSGSSSGTNTGDQTSVSGNAGTATKLQTARNINGVAFDGTANIVVTAAAGTLTGATLAAGVTASSLTSVGTLATLAVAGSFAVDSSANLTTNGYGAFGDTVTSAGSSAVPAYNGGAFGMIATPSGLAAGGLYTLQPASRGAVGMYFDHLGTSNAGYWQWDNGSAGGTQQMLLGGNGNLTITGTVAASNLSGTNTGDQTTISGNAGSATKLATARAINGVNFDGTAPITVTAAAGTLTGTTLNATVVTSSLTAVGTLAAGAVPASLITSGTFGNGDYVFPGKLSSNGSVSLGNGTAWTFDGGSGDTIFVNTNFSITTLGVTKFAVDGNGKVTTASSLTTAAPAGGTAAPWFFGSVVGTTVTPNTSRYLEVEVNGTTYGLITAF